LPSSGFENKCVVGKTYYIVALLMAYVGNVIDVFATDYFYSDSIPRRRFLRIE